MKQKGDQRNMSTKAEHAAELHQRGCNCAQAVACTFAKNSESVKTICFVSQKVLVWVWA